MPDNSCGSKKRNSRKHLYKLGTRTSHRKEGRIYRIRTVVRQVIGGGGGVKGPLLSEPERAAYFLKSSGERGKVPVA